MSLPPATKEISDKPGPTAVVDPVNKQAKDADIDRKIRLYGVIQAFRRGRLPSNKQIDKTLKYVLDNSPVDTEKLSHDGKKLIQDMRDIIETSRVMVREKNADELFQQFIWHTRQVDTEGIKGTVTGGVEAPDKEKLISDNYQAVQHLRTLLSLVLTNSEVRKLLSDFSTIGRDLLSITAQKASELVAPSQEKLKRVDESAPSDQFITEGGKVAGKGDTPVLETRIPGSSATEKQDLNNGEARIKDESGKEHAASHVLEKGKEKVSEAKDRARGHAEGVNGDVQGHSEVSSGEEADAKKRSLMDRMKDVKDNLADRVPQEHKDRLDRSKRFLTEEYFPEERRDQFIFRGKKVIIECQKHEDYQQSIRWLLGYFEKYSQRGKDMMAQGQEGVQSATEEKALNDAITEIRTLLERFANGRSMDIIADAFNALADDAKRDEGLSNWFKDIDAYVHKVLLEPGYVLEEDCDGQANRLKEIGRQFYDEKYKPHFDNLFNSVGSWFSAMGDDPLNVRFGQDWQRLTRNLLFDSEGSLKFKTELWNDIRKTILPQIVDKVGYIPIPRIEYTDEGLDLVVENLTLSGRNLFPNIISLEAHNYVKFSPYNAIQDESHHRFTISFGQMQADMRDVAFYFKKKTGMPRMTDSGLADVVIGGQGLHAHVVLVSAGKDRTSVFKIHDIHVKVESLKFSIRDSKHDLLYKTLKPLATGLVKRQIQKAIADAIQTGLEYVDGQLVAVRDKMEAARTKEGKSKTEALQELFQRQKDEVSTKSVTSGGSQFKVVSNKRNSILSSTGHPAGWVNRTTEKDELASKGEEWRSEAFNIV